VVANIFFNVHPYFGEMIQFDEHIFPLGWFNHQQVKDISLPKGSQLKKVKLLDAGGGNLRNSHPKYVPILLTLLGTHKTSQPQF